MSLVYRGTDNPGDLFGQSLAVGDFNGDGFDDLAIGAPAEDVSPAFSIDVGAVTILFGSITGLTSANSQLCHQDITSVKGVMESGNQFGKTLEAGDFNGDGIDDLAIGVPYENDGIKEDAGAVHVLFGTLSSLSASSPDDHLFLQSDSEIPGASEAFDLFGASLASGDLNGDTFDELIIGSPGENTNAGGIRILFGEAGGFTFQTFTAEYVDQDSPIVNCCVAQQNDRFGATVALSDINADGFDDLFIGVPGEDNNAGVIHSLLGSPLGVSSIQELVKAPGPYHRPGNELSSALALGDYNAPAGWI